MGIGNLEGKFILLWIIGGSQSLLCLRPLPPYTKTMLLLRPFANLLVLKVMDKGIFKKKY